MGKMGKKVPNFDFDMDKAKEKFEQVLGQAKESVKIIKGLQKESMERARSFIKIPSREFAENYANQKLVSSLKKLGLATRSEVRDLEKRVEDLASELRTQISKVSKKTSTKTKDNESSL